MYSEGFTSQILYKETESWRPSLNILDVQTITEEEQILLSRDFEEEETFHKFHAHQKFEKSFNAIFVALIPKKVGANELKDFRPISLITGVYKIIAKVLAQRLKKVISKLINKHQMAFIKGRQIIDAALLANDTLVFCEAEQEQICYLRVILVVFEACSGLKVNWRKSSNFPIKEVQQIEDLASILKCKIEKLPTVYLGMPLGSEHKAEKNWDGIIEKTEKKLAIWKSQYLSLGGMDSLPTYVMSLFPIPSRIVKVLDALRRNFLWQGNKIEKGFNLVKWTIRNLWESLKNNSKIVVGRGDKTKFWLDDWCGNGILRDLFPILFSICTNTNSKIEEIWSPQGWNIIFRRLLNDWEIDGMVECLGLIGGFPGTTLEPDRLAWGHHKDGVFSVNRLYNWGLKRRAGRSIGPWNTTWKSVAPVKVKCFTWLVARKKCLTHEAMQKRHINIVWALFTRIANEYWTMPEHTSDLLSCWIKMGGSKSQKRWWRTVPACFWGKEQDIEEEFQLVDFIGSLFLEVASIALNTEEYKELPVSKKKQTRTFKFSSRPVSKEHTLQSEVIVEVQNCERGMEK
uniref:Reverse transcriptase zinc-binding domain-containing protein n=1 Tax=Solanum demissum TaxID=50514 RepID=Q6L3H4_SOLDE|nr:hypothetical protein SDM1_4t00019 [Solanum demissum]